MASDAGWQHFKKGAIVEVCSDDDGFRGSWFIATVIRPPRNSKKGIVKVVVEYDTLTEDDTGKKPLREELNVIQLRPPPPREARRTFKFAEEVDAYYNDGWWEGTITKVDGDDKFHVFFSGTREQIAFSSSDMRLHREWVHEKWVPPLEPSAEADKPMDSEEPAKVNAKNTVITVQNYNLGDTVEVSSNEEGFEGAWFAATILKKLGKGKYLVEYQTLKDDDDSTLIREEVENHFVRPVPPYVEVVNHFEVGEEVEASCNEGWWGGVISKVLKDGCYCVDFSTSGEVLKFKHTDLRLRRNWVNGKWEISKGRKL